MEVKKKLFLIDAYALIFRGYYAFIKNPRINSKGLDTSAILGFTNSLFDVIKREKPEFLAVCFDKGGSKDRIKIYEKYKANRDETPEAIKVAVPIIEKSSGLKLNKESPEYINGVHLYNGFPNSYGKKLNSNCPESSYIELPFSSNILLLK